MIVSMCRGRQELQSFLTHVFIKLFVVEGLVDRRHVMGQSLDLLLKETHVDQAENQSDEQQMSESQEAMFPEMIGSDFVDQANLRSDLSIVSDQVTQVLGGTREEIREQAFAIE